MRWRTLPLCGLAAAVGCATPDVRIPGAHMPKNAQAIDVGTSQSLGLPEGKPKPVPPLPMPPGGNKTFDLPSRLPGADTRPLMPLKFDKDTPKAEREAAIKKAYPELVPAAATEIPGTPMSLADFQQLAALHSPALRRAEADA